MLTRAQGIQPLFQQQTFLERLPLDVYHMILRYFLYGVEVGNRFSDIMHRLNRNLLDIARQYFFRVNQWVLVSHVADPCLFEPQVTGVRVYNFEQGKITPAMTIYTSPPDLVNNTKHLSFTHRMIDRRAPTTLEYYIVGSDLPKFLDCLRLNAYAHRLAKQDMPVAVAAGCRKTCYRFDFAENISVRSRQCLLDFHADRDPSHEICGITNGQESIGFIIQPPAFPTLPIIQLQHLIDPCDISGCLTVALRLKQLGDAHLSTGSYSLAAQTYTSLHTFFLSVQDWLCPTPTGHQWNHNFASAILLSATVNRALLYSRAAASHTPLTPFARKPLLDAKTSLLRGIRDAAGKPFAATHPSQHLFLDMLTALDAGLAESRWSALPAENSPRFDAYYCFGSQDSDILVQFVHAARQRMRSRHEWYSLYEFAQDAKGKMAGVKQTRWVIHEDDVLAPIGSLVPVGEGDEEAFNLLAFPWGEVEREGRWFLI
ncbi:hypothetical protein EJ04DRAFT_581523 [Polyplosphaeria fusca]|uniref:Uncharacterized protein n=1 Tax=Polyplosphaeria fusca TaxID=682080 RepID=A0A9P4UWQ3_9PLEO|nr:hypothetical protein EJ04DRAFT_581523 [Polyplosphaeria fusca]